MKLKLSLLVLLAVCSFSFAEAQQRDTVYANSQNYVQDSVNHNGFQKEKLFFGGNIGLSFGSMTYINLSPLIGYRFSKMLSAGVQLNGVYESVDYGMEKDRYGMLGLGVFGRFYPIPQIFLQVQPEADYYMGKTKYNDGTSSEKYQDMDTAFLVGGGYSQTIGRNNDSVIMLLYDVLQNDNSPYGNQPIFRAGVNIGF